MDGTTVGAVRQISLLDSLERGEWIKVPLQLARDIGPASVSLVRFRTEVNTKNYMTFKSVKTLADGFGISEATFRKHLTTLKDSGYIRNDGRGKTKGGAPRRTCDLHLTKKGAESLEGDYGVLPLWATSNCNDRHRLTWGAQVLLSIVMSELMGLHKLASEEYHPDIMNDDDPWENLEVIGEDRFRFSLRKIQKLTGLDHKTASHAKVALGECGIVKIGQRRGFDGNCTDTLWPNEDFVAKAMRGADGNDKYYF